jgi:16S rRNA (cytidine1402-2'-O)-methyltransferase
MPGTLFVIGTPIGNLEDITFRAVRTLGSVDVIAAEDTRRTANLLAHYNIRKPVISHHEHNEVRETPRLIGRLKAGESIGLVTDAGTPGISDPGARLVRAALDAGLPVVPIPGPSAVTTALSVAGVLGSEFVFMGFPPRSGSARDEWFSRLTAEPRAVVLFESPHRLTATVGEITDKLSGRRYVMCHELTKSHESLAVRPILPVDDDNILGEFVIVVDSVPAVNAHEAIDSERVATLFGRITEIAGVDEHLASIMVAAATGLRERAIHKIVKKHRFAVKQQNRPAP